jgi:hypothetical protein
MEVDYMIIADEAAAAEGKHYIHGAGWDILWGASFPITHPLMAIAVRLRTPWVDTNQPHELTLDVVDGDGNSVLEKPLGGTVNVGRPATTPPGNDQVTPLAFRLIGVKFPHPGDYAVIFRIDGIDRSRSPFRVIEAKGPPAPTR